MFLQTKPNRLFCSKTCKYEWNRFGNSYGPLRNKLEKLIRQQTAAAAKAQLAELRQELADFSRIILCYLDMVPAIEPRTPAEKTSWENFVRERGKIDVPGSFGQRSGQGSGAKL